MTETFFFYDLETSGIDPREQRIMQFAGQRTNLSLEPIGEPFNFFIRLTDDILPDPQAILVTGITPQKTLDDGISEAEFLKIFSDQIATPGTIFTGFNNVRFDDEFMRYLHYRNFYDPFAWHWRDGKSRWDLLDVSRMTRALRPAGINWPMTDEGKPTNRLELITELNGLDHQNAHDAMSDVMATIAVAKLIYTKQPKLFDYLLKMRSKTHVEALVKSMQPFVYSSGKYSGETEKTTVAVFLADNPRSGALVYDLRHDPTPWLNLSAEELAESWRWRPEKDQPRLPIKTLQYNRCPAVAPLGVLNDDSRQRLKINCDEIEQHRQKLRDNHNFMPKVLAALDILNRQQQAYKTSNKPLVDGQLYDGFFNQADSAIMQNLRQFDVKDLVNFIPGFKDRRLKALLPLYRVRNYPNKVSDEDRQAWEEYRYHKFYDGESTSRVAKFFDSLSEVMKDNSPTDKQQFLLEELKLYAESILPEA